MATIGLVSLGCDKNLINSEQMLWRLMAAGHEILETAELAQVVIVNTCAFIEASRLESVENIHEIVDAMVKNRVDGVGGNVEHIIVAGCLAERYRDEIMDEIPEVDAVVGCGSFDEIVEVVERVTGGETGVTAFGDINAPLEECPRFVTGESFSAYLKIAEGCSNNCAYCVIPSLRGRFRSREMDKIVDEAEALAQMGAKEIILVAQDLTMYGRDLYGKAALPELIDRICALEDVRWLRLLYLYPEGVTDELIDCIKRNQKVLRCLDIPIQHINSGILKAMRRRTDGEQIRTLFTKLRAELPDVVIRTSIIIGLPGEGEEEFAELCDFLREYKPERAGFFAYSPEEGTPAAEMERPDEDIVSRRMETAEMIRDEIVEQYNESLIGKTIDVLCEGADPIIKLAFGRTYADAPEIDGKVFFQPRGSAKPGDIKTVLIEETMEGDLFGKML